MPAKKKPYCIGLVPSNSQPRRPRRRWFATKGEADKYMVALEKKHPVDVARGDYYYDAPEHKQGRN